MTWRLKQAGGKSCSVCGNEYIIPRTEWVEWWYCIPDSGPHAMLYKSPVPLLRRGYSWACWEENAAPLITGWCSALMPEELGEGTVGFLDEMKALPKGRRRTVPRMRG